MVSGLTPFHLGLCVGCLNVLKVRRLDSPRGARCKKARGGVAVPLVTGLQKFSCQFHPILFVRSEPLSPYHVAGKRN